MSHHFNTNIIIIVKAWLLIDKINNIIHKIFVLFSLSLGETHLWLKWQRGSVRWWPPKTTSRGTTWLLLTFLFHKSAMKSWSWILTLLHSVPTSDNHKHPICFSFTAERKWQTLLCEICVILSAVKEKLIKCKSLNLNAFKFIFILIEIQ